MRAAVYEKLGASAEVLRVDDVPTPEPGPGEVRLKVQYSGVNPTDWKSRSGATDRRVPDPATRRRGRDRRDRRRRGSWTARQAGLDMAGGCGTEMGHSI